jgi:hypothetical protein
MNQPDEPARKGDEAFYVTFMAHLVTSNTYVFIGLDCLGGLREAKRSYTFSQESDYLAMEVN